MPTWFEIGWAWARDNIAWAGVATWVGIVANLVWNFINHRRTNKARSDAIRLDEFKRLRTPAEAALSSLRVVRSKLRALEASNQTAVQLRKAISELNQQTAAACSELELALGDMDQSQFAEGLDWSQAISEPLDALFSEFDKAYAPRKKESQILQSVSEIVRRIDELGAAVRSKLDNELARYSK